MPKETQEKIPSGQQRGVVVMFDAERAFGFIRPDGAKEGEDKDVFVHVRNVEGHKNLHPGQRVSYHLTRTDKGPAAINVQAGSVLGIPYLKYSLIGLGTALLLLFGLAIRARSTNVVCALVGDVGCRAEPGHFRHLRL